MNTSYSSYNWKCEASNFFIIKFAHNIEHVCFSSETKIKQQPLSQDRSSFRTLDLERKEGGREKSDPGNKVVLVIVRLWSSLVPTRDANIFLMI